MRDRVTRAIVATAFLASLFVPVRAGAAVLPDQDVTVGTLINASHDGRVAGATERPPLTRAWSRELGFQVSPPVIVDGKVFVIGGSDTEVRLHALHAATGNDVWGPVLLVGGGRLAYGAGRIFVAGRDGRIRAFVPNLVVAKLGSDGGVSLYNSAGTTHVILDVVGWYGP